MRATGSTTSTREGAARRIREPGDLPPALQPNDPSRKGEALMPKLHPFAATLVATAALSASPAVAAPVTVNLRVEGATQTIYEAPVTTDAHLVDGGDGTGAHECDGLNNGNPNNYAAAGPSVTGALDD